MSQGHRVSLLPSLRVVIAVEFSGVRFRVYVHRSVLIFFPYAELGLSLFHLPRGKAHVFENIMMRKLETHERQIQLPYCLQPLHVILERCFIFFIEHTCMIYKGSVTSGTRSPLRNTVNFEKKMDNTEQL